MLWKVCKRLKVWKSRTDMSFPLVACKPHELEQNINHSNLVPPKMAMDSWFEGYSWTILYCEQCGAPTHLGWKYTKQVSSGIYSPRKMHQSQHLPNRNASPPPPPNSTAHSLNSRMGRTSSMPSSLTTQKRKRWIHSKALFAS